MDYSDRMSVRGSFSVAPSIAATNSEFGDGLSLGLTAVNENLSRFLSSFPKEVKRKNIQDLYFSLLLGTLEGTEEYFDIGNALLALLFNVDTPYVDRLLAVNCLQLLTPQNDLCSTMSSGEINCLVPCLPVVLAQGPLDVGFQNIILKLIGYLTSENTTVASDEGKILGFFNQLAVRNIEEISSENTKAITAKLLQGLEDNPSSSDTPKQRKSEASKVIREMDGAISLESLTPLSIAEQTTQEQLLKIQSFSMILSWLRSICDIQTEPLNSQAFKIGNNLKQLHCVSLRNYALRLIEQSERFPLIPSNMELQKACLVEAFLILDVVCTLDQEQVALVLSTVRKIFDRSVSAHYQDVSICVTAAQFLIKHSNVMMHKVDDIGPHLMSDIVSACYHDPAAAFEVIKFVRDNLTRLCYHSSILERYFPSLLKLLAWHPGMFESDFVHITPAFLASQTAIEVFHSLVDLPCLTASLMISQSIQNQSKGSSEIDPSLTLLYQLPEYQPMFNFVLRPTGGMGHTFDRLSAFHKSISKLSSHARVKRSAKAVIPLLRCFAQVFVQFADTGLASLIFPAILERLTLLFPVPGYKEEINSFLAEFVIQLLEKHPNIVVHLHEELTDYLSKVQNSLDSPEVFTHLVWAVGEFLSLSYTDLFRLEVVSTYYNTLECLIYEFQNIFKSVPGESKYKLICVLLTTLAQLATRCQDLLPRAILCLSKCGQKLMVLQEGESLRLIGIAVDRVRELRAILGTPNVASLVLSPPKEIYTERLHEDSTSLPMTLKTIVSIMDPEESIVK